MSYRLIKQFNKRVCCDIFLVVEYEYGIAAVVSPCKSSVFGRRGSVAFRRGIESLRS
jgi:hypothetical protein